MVIYWLVSGDANCFLACFRIVPGWFHVVLDDFRSFQVVPCFGKYIDVLVKKSVV